MRLCSRLAAFAFGLAVAASPAWAGPWTELCAGETASRSELGYESTGRHAYDVNVEAAIAACTRAAEVEPDPAVTAWLARALTLASRWDEAMPLALEAADAGSLLGMHLAGAHLIESADPAEAKKGRELLEKAVGAGFAPSLNSLGYAYENGFGVDKDSVRALALYREAAGHGVGVAQTNIGLLYREGLAGLPKNEKTSVEWFTRGALNGDPNGMDALGYAYEWGLGVPQDLAESARWYGLGAAKNYPQSLASLAYAYDYGKGVPQDYARAMALYRSAWDGGTAWAGTFIGRLYLEGHGVERDIGEAQKWIDLGLAWDDYTAMYLMGRKFEDGLGVPRDLDKAGEWYRKAIEAGDTVDAPPALARIEAAGS